MRSRPFATFLAVLVLVLAALAGWVAWRNVAGEAPVADAAASAAPATPAQVERGRYLALAGNCAGCHTVRGGAPYAGGGEVPTPFGTVFTSNLTPDTEHGIGRWNADHFWRALHHGRSRDGRLLYPAFPYTNYTHMTREDSDAVFAYLRSLPAVAEPNRAHTLRFPYSSQAALAVWRALFFRPGNPVADASRPAEWNRGAYLVGGLAHCSACHSPRNAFGATSASHDFDGGLIPAQGWYAPALTSAREAGVADWSTQEIVDLLKTGTSARGSVMGPMAEVVFGSTQHLSEDDLRAMASYLQSLPQTDRPAPPQGWRTPEVVQRGRQVYDVQCTQCHGADGQGAPGAYPPLAGNRAVNMPSAVNLVQIVRRGGFLPATEGNPRPYGMPPFGHVLGDADIAAVLTYIRSAWGNSAGPVSQLEVMRR